MNQKRIIKYEGRNKFTWGWGLLHQSYWAEQSPLCSGRGDLWQGHTDSQSEGSVVYMTHQANRYDTAALCLTRVTLY